MTGSQIDLDHIVEWFRSTGSLLSSGVRLTDVKQKVEHLPAAYADFDGLETMGRMSGWVTGSFDFEVIRTADGSQMFFRHLEVMRLDDPLLNAAVTDFLAALT